MHSMCMFQQVTKKSNKLHLLDQIPLNPCSLVNVASVLREIGKEVRIGRYGGDNIIKTSSSCLLLSLTGSYKLQ